MRRLARWIRNLFAKPVEWNCVCGWHGEETSWSDPGVTVDAMGFARSMPFRPICPHCFRAL